MFGTTLKDKVTNITGLLMIIGGAVNAYLQSLVGEINWFQLAFSVLGAVVAYFTGKASDGSSKKPI